jgi:transposase
MERVFLEHQLAAGRSLEQIGAAVGKHPSTVGYWVKKHGLRAVHSDKYAPRGGIERDRIAALVDQGLTTRAIARGCSVSYSTVRYWLKRYGIDNARPYRRSDGPQPRLIQRRCRTHGLASFVLEGRGYYRCTRCRMAQVAKRRRKVKAMLVAEAGGRCALCGYDSHQAALEFHHLDPSQKSFELSARGITRGIDRLRAEARKCVLLCANCHASVEVGALTI